MPGTVIVYELMHREQKVAEVDGSGRCRIISPAFMPFSLWLEEETDIDTRMNNLVNWYAWCAGRMLTLDRKYAKEILNSIGVLQARTDRERAEIALGCHCLTLTDVWWVRRQGEETRFSDINLYENHLSNAFVDVSLCGRQMSVTDNSFQADLSTGGACPKAWVRDGERFLLYKDGDEHMVENELLASRIAQCFPVRQVSYWPGEYEEKRVSVSELASSLDHSLVSRAAYEIYAANRGFSATDAIWLLDPRGFALMNIIDYLVGNTDRHWENWGLFLDNRSNTPVCLYPLMDFNQAFHAYDGLEGANCLTVTPQRMSQKAAALEAVQAIGLPMRHRPMREWFADRDAEWDVFSRRLALLEDRIAG